MDDPWGLARLKAEMGERLPKFLFTCGENDAALKRTSETAEYLVSLGAEAELESVPGYSHEWDFWDLALKRAITQKFALRRDVIRAVEV